MSPLITSIVAILALILCVLLAYIFKVTVTSFKSKIAIYESQQQVSDLLVNEMKAKLEHQKILSEQKATSQTEQMTDTDQVIKQLDYRVSVLQDSFSELKEQFQHAIEQQPEDKFYSRASKLVEKGADLKEIMKECELPQAEAEMLLSMYKSKND